MHIRSHFQKRIEFYASRLQYNEFFDIRSFFQHVNRSRWSVKIFRYLCKKGSEVSFLSNRGAYPPFPPGKRDKTQGSPLSTFSKIAALRASLRLNSVKNGVKLLCFSGCCICSIPSGTKDDYIYYIFHKCKDRARSWSWSRWCSRLRLKVFLDYRIAAIA